MRFVVLILQLCIFQSLALSQSSAQLICEKSPLPVADATLKYELRGNRCEGLFLQPVAASSHLRIIGYHLHSPIFTLGSSAPIRILVDDAAKNDVTVLRALSTRLRQYYRMDTRLQSTNSFAWDRTLINNQEIALRPSELAMVACGSPCDDATQHLFPVSLVADMPTPQAEPEIIFSSNVDLSKLLIKLVRLPNGKPVEEEILHGRLLLALTPQRFMLENSLQAGTYHMTATAIPRYSNTPVDVANAVISVP